MGLRGRPHPLISNVFDTKQVKNMRPHLKLLCGDYLTYEKKSLQSGGSARCRLCSCDCESVSHILTSCESLSEPRQKLMSTLTNFCNKHNINLQQFKCEYNLLTQFILDPTSFNLPQRVNINDPILPEWQPMQQYSLGTYEKNEGTPDVKIKCVKSVNEIFFLYHNDCNNRDRTWN